MRNASAGPTKKPAQVASPISPYTANSILLFLDSLPLSVSLRMLMPKASGKRTKMPVRKEETEKAWERRSAHNCIECIPMVGSFSEVNWVYA